MLTSQSSFPMPTWLKSKQLPMMSLHIKFRDGRVMQVFRFKLLPFVILGLILLAIIMGIATWQFLKNPNLIDGIFLFLFWTYIFLYNGIIRICQLANVVVGNESIWRSFFGFKFCEISLHRVNKIEYLAKRSVYFRAAKVKYFMFCIVATGKAKFNPFGNSPYILDQMNDREDFIGILNSRIMEFGISVEVIDSDGIRRSVNRLK